MRTGSSFNGGSVKYHEGQHLLCVKSYTDDYIEGNYYTVKNISGRLKLSTEGGRSNYITASLFVQITHTATEDDFAELVG